MTDTRAPWFRVRAVDSRIHQIDEPHVDPLLRANIWHVRGRDRDLVVDTGLGVVPLRDSLPTLFERDPVVVLTHSHLDHMGGAHEFDRCFAHPGEPFQDPPPGSLRLQPLLEELGLSDAQWNSESQHLLERLPDTDYAVTDYRLRPPAAIEWLHDGSSVDLGDAVLTVLHLPGHTPASIALFDETTGDLFSGDVVYDDTLIDDCVGANVADYCQTMERLIELDVTTVRPGHGDGFSRERLHEIAHDYLRAAAS